MPAFGLTLLSDVWQSVSKICCAVSICKQKMHVAILIGIIVLHVGLNEQ